MAIVKVHTADMTPTQTSPTRKQSGGRHQSTRGIQNGLSIVSEEGESDDLKNNNDDDNEDKSEDESESKNDDSEDDNKDKEIDGNKGDDEDEENFLDDDIENDGYEVRFVDDEVEDNQDSQNRQATYASSALNSDDRADSSSQYSSDEDSGNEDGVLVEELGYLNIV
ncbi:hypothetical protein V502_00492 [Pseudogymnoascus sp. VKM F-4520 (FW-2644)]|nr:hypothetical protein V502_00492 [Pseudogymnoascus sp. VKM F-4520 (FW-2644)]